jgi:hypothetical protein
MMMPASTLLKVGMVKGRVSQMMAVVAAAVVCLHSQRNQYGPQQWCEWNVGVQVAVPV